MRYKKLSSVRFIIVSILGLGAFGLSAAQAQDRHLQTNEISRATEADKHEQQSKSCLDQKSPTRNEDPDHDRNVWERDLRFDGVRVLEAQVYLGNTCFTPVGSCVIYNGPLPVGTPCWCPSPYGRVGGTVGLP